MNTFRFSFIICLGFILIPSLAWGVDFNSVPLTDKSMQYLGAVFGKMGSLPVAPSGNALFSNLMLLFNQIVLALAVIIVAYTIVVSTIHTAHEGQVMGQKWSSIFIPARIGAGLWLLVPASAGYSYIQIIIMWILVQGVGVANSLWEQVLIAYDNGQGVYSTVDTSGLAPQTSPTFGSASIDESTVRGIFTAQVCVQLVNKDPETLDELTQGTPLSVFRSADGSQIIWGIESTGQPVCGALTLPQPTLVNQAYSAFSNVSDAQFSQMRDQIADLILSQVNPAVENAAEEAVTSAPDSWSDFSSLVTAQSQFTSGKQSILTNLQTGGIPLQSQLAQNALDDGWIHAGSYYSKLVAGNQAANRTTLSVQVAGPNFSIIGAGSIGEAITQNTTNLANQYLTQAADTINTSNAVGDQSRGTPPGSYLPWPFNEIVDAITSPFWGVADQIMSALSGKTDNTDPILAMSKMGGLIIEVTEGIFFLAFIPLALVGLLTSVAKGVASAGHVFSSVMLAVLLPLFLLFLAFFYVAGISLALYIPLIPFFVFTFSAIAWMILVIEAIVAAPLVAMILVVPSEDELGKAGYALVILLGLLLRPALMILGLIVAIKFVLISAKLLNFGFSSVVYERRPSFSIFFPIAVVVLYAGILTYIVHEAFSLIYIIPDKVLRWMGGTPEGEDIMGKVKKTEGDVEKGAGSLKSGIGALASSGKSGVAVAGKAAKK